MSTITIKAEVKTIIIKGCIYRYFLHDGYYYGFDCGEPVKTKATTLAGFKRWATK